MIDSRSKHTVPLASPRGKRTPPGRAVPAVPALVRAALWASNVYRRLLGVALGVAGPRVAYAFTGLLARWLYRSLEPFRLRSEAQCRAALGGRVPAERIPEIAERSFVHRIWNLTDLMLADRLLHPRTCHRYGGRLPEEPLAALLAAQRRRQPIILLTGYYGPFDLLPMFLGFNGVRAGVVYRPHGNAAFDAYRKRIRGRGGCEMIPVDQAAGRLGDILHAGGTVAIVADHHAERGLPVTFLGLPTKAWRTVGLLAWRYEADLVVAGIRRVRERFQFEIVLTDTVKHEEWQREPEPVAYLTHRYLGGLERIILDDPTQYIWGYARWGAELAEQLVAGESAERSSS